MKVAKRMGGHLLGQKGQTRQVTLLPRHRSPMQTQCPGLKLTRWPGNLNFARADSARGLGL